MAEEPTEGVVEKSMGKVDSFFNRVANYISKQISVFVAFLFFLFTAGAVYGAWIVYRQVPFGEILLITPAVLGLLAYYNRTFATIIFISVIVLFVII